MTFPRTVLILGSTGSIGTQALEVVRRHADRFQVVGLAAGGSRPELFAAQAAAYPDAALAVASDFPPGPPSDFPPGPPSYFPPGAPRAIPSGAPGGIAPRARNDASRPGFGRGRRLFTGPDAATDLVTAVPADVVLNGITGSIGLGPTMAALKAGRTLALANKESLVAGGSLVTSAARPGQIVPVDSEHSALAQCLRGGSQGEVAKLVLTASGGPFRGRTRAQLAGITVAQALAHPTWAMGPMVTVNSATLVNKGLEVIEAHLLFDVPYERIDVVVHPQSVIHSMVTFQDGSTLAQASPPDMRLPIALALSWPDRLDGVAAACDFQTASTWTFEPVDNATFPALDLARAAGAAGGLVPAVFNAANEQAVGAFLAGKIAFTGITHILAGMLEESDHARSEPGSISDVLLAEQWARARADELTAKYGEGDD